MSARLSAGWRRHRVALALLFGIGAGWCWLYGWSEEAFGPPGKDLYQVWLGARVFAEGRSPYGAAVQAEMRRAYGWWGQHGLPYPLPALWLHLPLALLPLGVAVAIWKIVCLAMIVGFAARQGDWRIHVLLPLLFVPIVRALQLNQPTLSWMALACVTVVALQRRWPVLAGLGLALMPAKPQVGLIFAVVGWLWAWWHDRRSWWWTLAWGLVIWGGSLVLLPDWWRDCLAAVRNYRVAYGHLMVSAWPWGLALLLPALRLPWWAWAATAQVVLFPAHDVYVLSPLLLVWIAIGGLSGLVGVCIGWVGEFVGVNTFQTFLWLWYLLPCGLLMVIHLLRRDRARYAAFVRITKRAARWPRTRRSALPES